jgi:hypothetical protein
MWYSLFLHKETELPSVIHTKIYFKIIATPNGLGGPRIESRGGSRFSTPLLTGPVAHTASCVMGNGSLSRG